MKKETPNLWYHRDGTPCSTEEAMRYLQDTKNRVVKQEVLSSGYWISTVFLVLDHNLVGKGPPLLFETMVFEEEPKGGKHSRSIDCIRYATEAEAREGHEWMKRRWVCPELEEEHG